MYLQDTWEKSETWVVILDVQGWIMSYQLRDMSLPCVWSTLVKQGHFSRKYPVLALNHGQFWIFMGFGHILWI
jgi:hypothetical protein